MMISKFYSISLAIIIVYSLVTDLVILGSVEVIVPANYRIIYFYCHQYWYENYIAHRLHDRDQRLIILFV